MEDGLIYFTAYILSLGVVYVYIGMRDAIKETDEIDEGFASSLACLIVAFLYPLWLPILVIFKFNKRGN